MVDGLPCPDPGCSGKLRLTNTLVGRGIVWLEDNHYRHETIPIPLAKCDSKGKKHRRRVLPADIPPKKLFAAPAQETPSRKFVQEETSYRKTLSTFKGEVPHHSALHGWLGGLGHYALDRGENQEHTLKLSAVISETETRQGIHLEAAWTLPLDIHPDRYRTDERRAVLIAAKRLFLAAGWLASTNKFPLTWWIGLILSWLTVATIRWWARSPVTAFQRGSHRPEPQNGQKPKAKEPP